MPETKKPQQEGDNYPVSNFLGIKYLVDNENGQLTLIGTIAPSIFPDRVKNIPAG